MNKITWIFIIFMLQNNLALSQKVDFETRQFQSEPSHPFDVKHYRINLDIDADKRSLQGKVDIHLKSLRHDLKKIQFHAESYEILSVHQGLKSVPFQHKQGQLHITLNHPLNYGDSTSLHVEYGIDRFLVDPTAYGMGANYPLGIGFFEATPSRPSIFNSYSFPTGARHWFPCYDHPNDRATHETIVTTQGDHKVLANGILISTATHEDGRVSYHWSQNQPHPTYLYNFVSGPYEIVEEVYKEIPVNYWVYPGDIERGKRTFHRTPEVLGFFEDYYGVPYPWDKFDQIIVPGIGGGAEATTATLIGESTLHDEKAEKDFPSHWLIAHEAAHHWWGDFVSYADWTETWLSESFATYGEYLYSNHLYGAEEGIMNLSEKKSAYLSEAYDTYQRPIRCQHWNFPNENFDRHTYQKGALVLHMLNSYLGEDIFRKVLSHFLHAHAFQPVRTPDFVKSIWEVTGENMQWFFDQWILSPGHPILEIDHEWTGKETVLKIIQTQDTSEGIPIFKFPLTVEIHHSDGIKKEEVWVDQKKSIFRFASDKKPKVVLIDPEHILLKEWSHPKTKEELQLQVAMASLQEKLRAIQQLEKFADELSVQDLLSDQAQNADFWALRKTALTTLSHAKNHKEICLRALKDSHSRVRTESVRILGIAEDAGFADLFKDVYMAEDSYRVQSEALRALGKLKNASNKHFFEEAVLVDSPRGMIKKAAVWSLKELLKK